MRRNFLILGVLLVGVLLAACDTPTATGNAVSAKAPARTCSVPGFTCYVEASSPGVVQFSLRSSSGTDIDNVAVAVIAKECVTKPTTVSLGRVPGGAQNSVRFTCSPASDTITGDVTVSYTTRTGAAPTEVKGKITIRGG